MDNRDYLNGCLPTPLQEQLLRACLQDRAEAIPAWEHWIAATELEHNLDLGSYRLLPLLYKNLRRLEVESAFMPRLRNFYRSAWQQNHMASVQLQPLLAEFQAAGIPLILLKGAALTLRCYGDSGVRYMADVDWMVPHSCALQAMAILQQQGWMATFPKLVPLTSAVLWYRDAIAFEKPGHAQIDLHWRLYEEDTRADTERDLWQGRIPIEGNNPLISTLNPTDNFMHACVHGLAWCKVPSMRWVADACTLLKTDSNLDWDRLVAQAYKYQVRLPLLAAMDYLTEQFPVEVPQAPLMKLRERHVSRSERVHFQYRIQAPSEPRPLRIVFRNYLNQWLFLLRSYVRWNPDQETGQSKSLAGFLRMLQRAWGLSSLRQLPAALGRRLLQLGRHLISGL